MTANVCILTRISQIFRKIQTKDADAMHHQGVMLENLANLPQTQMVTSLHLWGNLIFPTLVPYIMYAKHMHS